MALVLLLLAAAAASPPLGDVTRHDNGDAFTLIGEVCGAEQCSEHGAGSRPTGAVGAAGAAGAVGAKGAVGAVAVAGAGTGGCSCACPQRAPLFREDRELCVDDLPECTLATFGSGNGLQKIPFVYLPLKGQIIHPSREIVFQGVKTPICAVSGAQFLTRKGFVDLRNTLDADVPFALFRDEGRTFLQWSGEDELRKRMSGRAVVVRLLCRDVAAAPATPLDLRGVFTPCVAFRVQGTPPRHSSNVTEVQFAPNAHTFEETATSGLSTAEYVAIGISSLLLGLIYVASVFLYLHIRKRKKTSEQSSTRKLRAIKKKDGSSLTEHDIVRINNERIQSLSNVGPLNEENGIIKKNPLLSMGRQFHEVKANFTSDSSCMSDSEDFPDSSSRSDDNRFSSGTTSAIVHPPREITPREERHETRDESGIERLPDEHVSIVETTDDREIARPVGTTRRKLYFNPAYFEPHLMAEPPAAALEFLVKIREVISIAKHKMAAKRFQPILNEIPEEETYPSNPNSLDIYQGLGSQRSSVVSLKRENSRKKSVSCVGCPGCKSDGSNDIQNLMKYDVPACTNCIHNRGDKQNSIRKWLENIPTVKQSQSYNDFIPNQHTGLVNSLLSLPVSEHGCKLKKQNSLILTKQPPQNIDHTIVPKKSSTLSVRSEPPIRSYNLPLPEFDNVDCNHRGFAYYGQTVSRVDDIKPIGFNSHRASGSRRNSITHMRKNKFITNKSLLPDMVNEAIALEHCSKTYNQSSSDEERFYNKIPNANNDVNERVKSESPPAEYETDSLERSSNKKGIVTSTDYIDIPSSQASPSLSTALPLEEELTMRNAVYKNMSSSNSNTPSPHREIPIPQNVYETIGETQNGTKKKASPLKNNSDKNTDYSLVSEVYVNNYNFGSSPSSPCASECSLGSRKFVAPLNKTEEKLPENPGSLTIEVKDSPENYIKIHESDGFEPDTLDRKHAKHNKEISENVQFSRKDFIKGLKSSPENQRIQLRSSGTFTKPVTEKTAKFNSLRSVYDGNNAFERPHISAETFNGPKDTKVKEDVCWEEVTPEWSTEEGRILTLELRHSKRQRQSTPPTIKQIKSLARPDILPPLPPTEEDHPIYEQPAYPPRRVEHDTQDTIPKNANGRSLSPRTFSKTKTVECPKPNSMPRKVNVGPRSPTRASVHSPISDYETINFPSYTSGETVKKVDLSRVSSKRRSVKSFGGSGSINTNTFVKSHSHKEDFKSRFRRKKGSNIEDSGYLSSDSACSRKVQRKLVITKLVSCSDSDDSENEARSESGAESVETHSVFFGSLRKHPQNGTFTYSRDKQDVRSSNRSFKQPL